MFLPGPRRDGYVNHSNSVLELIIVQPGCLLPWRVSTIESTGIARNTSDQPGSRPDNARRTRKSKKRRIVLRKRIATNRERQEQRITADANRDTLEKEKRTKRNREKKVKKKLKEKAKKAEGAEGPAEV